MTTPVVCSCSVRRQISQLWRIGTTFAVEFWNMRSRVADGLPRTNNSVEGWHHAFQSAVSCHHPTFYRLLQHLQKEQDNTEQQLARLQAGHQNAGSSKNKYAQVTQYYWIRRAIVLHDILSAVLSHVLVNALLCPRYWVRGFDLRVFDWSP